MICDMRCRIWDSGYVMRDTGCGIRRDAGYGIRDAGSGIMGRGNLAPTLRLCG